MEEDLPDLLGNMSVKCLEKYALCDAGAGLTSAQGTGLGDSKTISEIFREKAILTCAMPGKAGKAAATSLSGRKNRAQADLISGQQEIRMKMDYIEQDIERLKKRAGGLPRKSSFLKEAKAREDQEFARKQEKEREDRKQVRNVVGLFIHAGSRPFRRGRDLCASILGESPSLCGGRPSGVTDDYFYQRSRSRMLEAEADAFQSPGILKKSSHGKRRWTSRNACAGSLKR